MLLLHCLKDFKVHSAPRDVKPEGQILSSGRDVVNNLLPVFSADDDHLLCHQAGLPKSTTHSNLALFALIAPQHHAIITILFLRYYVVQAQRQRVVYSERNRSHFLERATGAKVTSA
jgi:hypothetical protein